MSSCSPETNLLTRNASRDHIQFASGPFLAASEHGTDDDADDDPDDADNRTIKRWIVGLEDLEAAGYIRPTGMRGECFVVTREGYAAADRPKGKENG